MATPKKKPTYKIAAINTVSKKTAGKIVAQDAIAKKKPVPNAIAGKMRGAQKPKPLPYKKYADPLSDAITREFAPATAKKPKKKK